MSRNIKILSVAAVAAVVLLPSLSFAQTSVSQDQINSLCSILRGLLPQLPADTRAQFETQVNQLCPQPPTPTTSCYTFETNLSIGAQGRAVAFVHQFLQKEGFSIPKDELAESQYGEGTASAVSGFQQKYSGKILEPLGLRFGTGFFGRLSRAVMNSLYGCGVVTPPPTEGVVQVISPNGGETWKKGAVQTILWKASVSIPAVDIYLTSYSVPCDPSTQICPLSSKSMPLFRYVIAQGTANDGAYEWTVPENLDGKYIMRVQASGGTAYDESDGPFSIVSTGAGLTVLSPNGGEAWQRGTKQLIRWSGSSAQTVDISLQSYVPPCTTYPCPLGLPSYNIPIVYGTPNDGQYEWLVPVNVGNVNVADGEYVIEVAASDSRDKSDGPFKITSETIVVNKPPVITGVSGPTSLQVGETGKWTITAYDPDGNFLNYSVDWGEVTAVSAAAGQAVFQTTSQTATFTHSYSQAGRYTITFTVSDSQGASARSTLTVDVGATTIAPSIQVLSPNGGETFIQEKQNKISWNITSPPPNAYVHLYLSPYVNVGDTLIEGVINCSGAVFYPTTAYLWDAKTVCAGGGSYTINPRSDYKVVARLYSWPNTNNPGIEVASDSSDAPFSIVSPPTSATLTVTSPNGGEQWLRGTRQTIRWSGGQSAYVEIRLNTFNPPCTPTESSPCPLRPVRSYVIASRVQNNGAFDWVVPNVITGDFISDGQYTIGISGLDYGEVDFSDKPFNIVSLIVQPQPTITIFSPASGEQWVQGTVQTISWSAPSSIAKVHITVQSDTPGCTISPTTCLTLVAFDIPNSGSFRWLIPTSGLATPGPFRMKIQDASNPNAFAVSNTFSILPNIITIISPAGSEQWAVGSTQTIKWSAPSSVAGVSITIQSDTPGCTISPTTCLTLVAFNTPNTGSFNWTVGSASGAGPYRMTIQDAAVPTTGIKATSNIFSIVIPPQDTTVPR